MNRFFINKKESIAITLAGLASVLLVAGIVYSSTIGTNISTGGTLTATGATSLGNTLGVTGLSTLAGFISTASSSVAANFNVAGPLSASSTLTVNGASTLTGLSTLTGGFVSSASSSVAANFNVAGPLSASSTLTVNGLSTLGGFLSSASSSVNNTFGVTGLATLRYASTTGISVTDNVNLSKLGVGTTTPTKEIEVTTAGTSTLYLDTSTANGSTCIQMTQKLGSAAVISVRMYPAAGGASLVVEPGSCK